MNKNNLFAWASISENGTVNGKKGDQTGNEVKVGKYYDFGQDGVIRFKNVDFGRKAGKIAKALAKNKAVGYSQSDRASLYNLAKKSGWNYDKLADALKTVKVNCDCSSFVSTIINLTFGRQAVACCTTSTLVNACNMIGEFRVVSMREFETKQHKGDMPIKEGKHVIINV